MVRTGALEQRMKLRPLGSTGINVSPLGLGTVKLGRNQQVKYPQGFDIPDDAQVSELLALAWELGINFIDTAPAYGTSEQRLGQLLPRADDWVIMTKVGEIFENGHIPEARLKTVCRNSTGAWLISCWCIQTVTIWISSIIGTRWKRWKK